MQKTLYPLAIVAIFSVLAFMPDLFANHLIAGLGLLGLLPGFALLRLLPVNNLTKRKSGKLGASILLSHSLFSCVLFAGIIWFSDRLFLTRNLLVPIMIGINVLTVIVSGLIRPFPPFKNYVSQLRLSWPTALPVLIILLATFLPILINGYAQDNDAFLSKTLAYASGTPASILDLRPLFPATLASVSILTSISPFTAFLVTPLILFLAAVLIFWDYLRTRLTSSPLQYAAVLAIISTPVTITELAITRPQVILIAYTLPLLIIGTETLRKKSLGYGVAGLLFSLLLLPFHELSAVLIALFLVSIVFNISVLLTQKKLRLRSLVWAAIIIIPYFFILPLGAVFRQLIGVTSFAQQSVGHLKWEWWFIDSYTSIDGTQLGWPGIGSLYYYLFNGIIFYLFLLGLLIVGKKRKPTNIDGSRTEWYFVLGFLGFFFFFAEIAPRLGFYFLPNRSWPYIALACCFCAIPLLKQLERHSLTFQKSIFALSALIAASGLAGIVKVATDNVAEVFPEEASAIQFISTTPADSVILSNQNNRTLAQLYGKRTFFSIDSHKITNEEALSEIINRIYEDLTTNAVQTITFETTTVKVNGKISSITVGPEEVVNSLQQIKPIPETKNVYYLYSKRKATGLVTERSDAYKGETGTNQVVPLFIHYPVAFEDSSAVLYRVSPR